MAGQGRARSRPWLAGADREGDQRGSALLWLLRHSSVADRVNLAIDPQIGRVKDMGSAAVGLALLLAAAAWLLALAERLGLI